MSNRNGNGITKNSPAVATREELMAVAKALADGIKLRESDMLQQMDKHLYDCIAKEPRSITVTPSQPADTSLIELALNSLVTKAVDQTKILEAYKESLPNLVGELVKGISSAMSQLKMIVTPQVLPAPLRVENRVESPQVFNQVDVPTVQVDVDLSSLERLLERLLAAEDREAKLMQAVLVELRELRSRKVVRTIQRNEAGEIESVTEEVS